MASWIGAADRRIHEERKREGLCCVHEGTKLVHELLDRILNTSQQTSSIVLWLEDLQHGVLHVHEQLLNLV